MNFIYLILLSSFFYGAYYFLIKLASGHINQILGVVILQVSAFLLSSFLLLFLKLNGQTIHYSKRGIIFVVLAGMVVSLAELLSLLAYSKGLNVSYGVPIIVGGSMIITALTGIIFLKESLGLIHYLAIIMILIGLIILTYKP